MLQLAGGNDGLNTLVPYADDTYHKLRPRLAKKEKDIIKLSDHVGLNPAMPFLGSLFKEGDLGIVQGVGYPNPNRSHFVSTSIWETGDTSNHSNTGWLGRYFDNACPGADPTVGISFNKTQPEAFGALKNPGVCLNSPELYRWIHGGGEQAQAEQFFAKLNQPDADDDAPVDGASIDMPAGGKPGVKGGLHCKHPSLTDLSQGDIQHTVDFRSVYGTLLSDWLRAPDLQPILGASYPKLGLIG